jgi:hypothetical protein
MKHFLCERKKQYINFQNSDIVIGIHQSNPAKTTAGVLRLALFLRNSKELLCLFDDEWCNRLWCVWELATYLRLRENPKVTFVCISQRSCEIIVVFVYFLQNAVTNALSTMITSLEMFESLPGFWYEIFWDSMYVEDFRIDQWQNVFTLSAYLACSTILATTGFIFGQLHFRSQDKLRQKIESYDIREARCAQESDRDILLRFVNEIFYEVGINNSFPHANDANTHGNHPNATSSTSHQADTGAYSVDDETNTQHPAHHAVSTSAHAEPIDQPLDRSLDFGIDAFNHAVRTEVPLHGVSITGIRKVKILSYTAAVLAPLQFIMDTDLENLTYLYDRWAFSLDPPPWNNPNDYSQGRADPAEDDVVSNQGLEQTNWSNGTWNSFRYALSICFDKFIMIPFGAFTFGVLVKCFLYLQELLMKHMGLRYWMTVVIFLPPFLLMEVVCCLRPQVINMIRSVTTDGCMKPWSSDVSDYYDPNTGELESRSRYMVADFSVWRGIYFLLVVFKYDVSYISDMQTFSSMQIKYAQGIVDTHFYYIYNVTPAIDICLWIFLVGAKMDCSKKEWWLSNFNL